MMRPVGDAKVYLHREPIDMRRGRNGLAALVREAMQQDPFAPEALYVFVGRRYDTLKILGWDRNGFSIWSKKIESDEKYRWPRMLEEAVVALTPPTATTVCRIRHPSGWMIECASYPDVSWVSAVMSGEAR